MLINDQNKEVGNTFKYFWLVHITNDIKKHLFFHVIIPFTIYKTLILCIGYSVLINEFGSLKRTGFLKARNFQPSGSTDLYTL